MMPITLANVGEVNIILRICGRGKMQRHLAKLGFIPGSEIQIVSKNNGSVIVNVKESRIALCENLANRIMV